MKCVSQTFGQKYRVAVPTFSLNRYVVCWPIKMVLAIIKMVCLFVCLFTVGEARQLLGVGSILLPRGFQG